MKKRPAFKLLFFFALFSIVFFYLNRVVDLYYFSGIPLAFFLLFIFSKRNALLYFALVSSFSLLFLNSFLDYSPIKYNKIVPDFKAVIEGEIENISMKDTNYAFIDVDGKVRSSVFGKPLRKKVRVFVFGNFDGFNTGDRIFANVELSLPKNKQIPTDFNEVTYYQSLGINFKARAKVEDIAITKKSSEEVKFYDKIKEALNHKIELLFSNNNSPIIKAIVLGDKSEINPTLKNYYSRSGTAHLLAVSGFHIGIIGFIFYFALSFIKNKWIKFSFFSVLIIIFIAVSGFQPSAIRAGAMAILFLFLSNFEREADGINILSFVVLIAIAYNPQIIRSIGFQMSVFAIAGIILFYTNFYTFFKNLIGNSKIMRFVNSSISITLSASLVTSILIAFYFEVFSIVSPISNLVVIPFFTLGAVFAFVAIIFSYVYFPLGSIYANASEVLLDITNSLITTFGNNELFYILGNDAIIFAFIASIFSIYLLRKMKLPAFYFRIASISIIAFLIVLNFKTEEKNVEIIKRNQFVALLIKNENENNVLIFDRKPRQYPFRDKTFEEFLINLSDGKKLNVGYNGNAGINISDYLKKEREIEIFEIDNSLQYQIKDYFKLDKHLIQQINYDRNY